MEHNENKDVEVKVKVVKRNAPKQVSFRLTDQEYWKLVGNAEESDANSVSDYAKKLVLRDGRRKSLVPKIAKEDSKEIIRQLNSIGNNINQTAKWLNENKHQAMFMSAEKYDDLQKSIDKLKSEVRQVWQQLS